MKAVILLQKNIPLKGEVDDLVAIMSVGAYGSVMANNYNMRTRPIEILIDGKKAHVIAQQESFEEIIQRELKCL